MASKMGTKFNLFPLLFSVQLPGNYYELNIHFGVFVGGMGDFNEIFLGNQENFRGCMEDVMFNGIDVMAKAKVSNEKPKFGPLKPDAALAISDNRSFIES